MRSLLLSALCFLLVLSTLSAQVTLLRDNGTPKGIHNNPGWEESVILQPEGPCSVVAVEIYFAGSSPASDTIFVVGDPSEGAVPPTGWVWSYNTLVPPFVIQYDGTPGWKRFDLSEMNIRSDGYDRIILQHRIDQGGLNWFVDNDAQSQPYGSFLMDPNTNNSLGFPGSYYLASGDFMVRLVVEYDFPQGEGSAPPPAPTMVEATREAGITDDAGEYITSSRVSVADWNGDGWDDIAAGSRFFQNNGDGTFTRVDPGISASASVWGDYDNDGDLDCYAARGGTNDDYLYRNNGDGTFTEVIAESGISNPAPTITPIWFDYDHDGFLDLFISNGRTGDFPNEIFYQDKLWINNGDGTFTDVTEAIGLAAGEPDPNYDCWGASPTDYNGDGWTDIFVATYRLAPDQLYRNEQGLGMTDVGAEAGVRGEPTADPSLFGHGIGTEWADYNNDGLIDLTVGNLGHPDWRGRVSNPSLVYRNDGAPDYRFTEVHRNLGIKFYEMNAGVVWGDFDQDGYQDLFHCQYSYQKEGASGEPRRLSRLYRSGGPEAGWAMQDITWHTGLLVHGAWTAARLDYDRDGDLDLVVASPREALHLYRNEMQHQGNSIVIRLKGDAGRKIPQDGYGTRVTVFSGDAQYFRELQGGGSGATGSQNSNALHFGVGDVEVADSIRVQWPDGTAKVYLNVETDREYLMEPGQNGLQEVRRFVSSVQGKGEPHREGGLIASGARYENGVVYLDLAVVPTGILDLELVNARGSIIRSERVQVSGGSFVTLPVGTVLESGVYILHVSDGTSRQSLKMQVVR